MTVRSLSILLASTLLSTSAIIAPAALTPAAAQINITLGAPPAPQFEAVPAPRPGYAWAPGFWQVQNNQQVWAPGRWMEARQDQHWVPDRWESYRDGGQEKWRRQAGRWDHDVHPGANRVDHDNRRDHDDNRRVDHDDNRRGADADHDGRGGNERGGRR